MVEVRRHHAEHGGRCAVERDRAADDRGVGAEVVAPDRLAQHQQALVAGALLLGEGAPQQRPHTHHVEEIRCHLAAAGADRPVAAGERERLPVPGRQIDDAARALRQVEVVQPRPVRDVAAAAFRGLAAAHVYDALRVGVRVGPQQRRVDQAEEPEVRADADRECRDCGEREARLAREEPQREPQLGDQCREQVHVRPLWWSGSTPVRSRPGTSDIRASIPPPCQLGRGRYGRHQCSTSWNICIARLLHNEEVFELEAETEQQLFARGSRGIAPPAGGELGEVTARQAEDLRPAIERQRTLRQLFGQSFVPETNPHVDSTLLRGRGCGCILSAGTKVLAIARGRRRPSDRALAGP
jgi:hypothetical protein